MLTFACSFVYVSFSWYASLALVFVLAQFISVYNLNKFLVSKETVVLRRWERSKQKFGFIKRVDKGEITTVKDLES